MPDAFIKPDGGIVQPALKILKTRRPDAGDYVPNLLRAAALPNNQATAAWSGDMYHRVGEWLAHQNQVSRSIDCLEASLEKFHPGEALGPARSCRDYAMVRVSLGQPDEGFALFDQARAYHKRDWSSDKGKRQSRITEAYVLQARVLSDDRSSALDELIHLALSGSGDFCLRDQQEAVNCALLFARDADRRALRVRQLELNLRQRRLIGTATSMAHVVIGTELHVAGQLIGSFRRKEWTLPRLS